MVDLVGVASAALAVALVAWRITRPLPVSGEPRPQSFLLHPWTLFLVTAALCVANQVAVGAYVLAAHGGNPDFITRYVGAWYFNCDFDFPGVRPLASALGPGGARWLEPSILRVNAFLELPFAMFAYLAIARLFDRAVPRLLTRTVLGPLAAASYTVILMVVEVMLWNPYTRDDLGIRVVAGVAMALALVFLGRRERGAACFPASTDRRRNLTSLLVAFMGAACAAGVVLGLYDLTLLYNLGHRGRLGGPLATMLVVATLCFVFVERLDRLPARRSACVEATASVAATFSAFFFVPALAVRYGLHHPTGRIVGLALLALSTVWGLVSAARAPGVQVRRWAIGLVAGLAAGTGSAAAVQRALPPGPVMIEALLVAVAVAFVGAMLFVWRVVERSIAPAFEANS